MAREDGRACRCAKETGTSYLTRTEDLKSNSQSGVVLVEKVSTILHYLTRTENLRLGDGCDVVLAGMPVMHA